MTICATSKFSVLTFALLSVASSYGDEEGKHGILMPSIQDNMPELYLCTPIRLNSTSDYYIVKFEPKATKDKVHHMVLYGCLTPGSRNPLWSCGGISNSIVDSELETTSPCELKPIVLYAWARNAPTLNLPPEVGFRVAGNTSIQYLVLQYHFAATNGKGHHQTSAATSAISAPDGSTSNVGLYLHYTRQPMRRLAGVFVLGSSGRIPPRSDEHWESSCTIVENKTIHPFAFRVHAHHLGTVVTGYRVRPDSSGKHHWTLIGRKNPQKPHMFYPVANNNISVTKGDILAARCTYYNNRTNFVYYGSTDDNEMCNFYVMYYVEEGEPLRMRLCWTHGAPFYYWNSELNNIPEDASDLE